ncbi:prolyl oligopeptidase family serine peptidase [Streptomyces sp. G44]|uniref:prolyl oligopeptidase family serine peptidase n=1 Tax=Streptomyces sp. G44 TaxID=2807632 RepID=UPI001961B7B6|nr:prolyl oligopeptidase family serine peptidase [Streptomyces sp. G44]MBM7168994.1 prolyl oligopeptidase family serine peptidase [Streptomyces sp. G44]
MAGGGGGAAPPPPRPPPPPPPGRAGLGRPPRPPPRARAGAGAPPFLLAHGDADSVVDHSHSAALAAALERAGVPAELWTVPGADHGWHGLPEAEVERIFTRSLDFVRARTSKA